MTLRLPGETDVEFAARIIRETHSPEERQELELERARHSKQSESDGSSKPDEG